MPPAYVKPYVKRHKNDAWMPRRTSLNANQAWWWFLKEYQYIAPLELTTDDDVTGKPVDSLCPLAAGVVAERRQNAPVSPAESLRACPRFDTNEHRHSKNVGDCTGWSFSRAVSAPQKNNSALLVCKPHDWVAIATALLPSSGVVQTASSDSQKPVYSFRQVVAERAKRAQWNPESSTAGLIPIVSS